MAIADLYTILFYKVKHKKKKNKRKLVGETRMAEFPTDDEVGQLIKEHNADRAIIVKEYELLPFE